MWCGGGRFGVGSGVDLVGDGGVVVDCGWLCAVVFGWRGVQGKQEEKGENKGCGGLVVCGEREVGGFVVGGGGGVWRRRWTKVDGGVKRRITDGVHVWWCGWREEVQIRRGCCCKTHDSNRKNAAMHRT